MSACQSIAQQFERIVLYISIGWPSTHESASLARALDGDVGDLRVVEQRHPELVALTMVLGAVGQEEALVVPAGQAHQPPARDRRPVLIDHRGLEQLGLRHEMDRLVAELERHDVAAVLAQLVDVRQRVREKPNQLDDAVVTRLAVVGALGGGRGVRGQRACAH